MNFLLSLRRQVITVLDAFIWYAYLLVLISVSFVNDYYSSQVWLVLSGCIYAISGLCAFSAINGGRCNWLGMTVAKYAIAILSAMLLLLVLQMIVPLSQHTELLLFNNSLFNGESPGWFQLRGRWSIVPDKTRWLFNSELLMFCMFVLSIALLSSRRRLKQLLTVLFIVGLTHSIVGIMAKYGDVHLVEMKQLDGHFSAARGWFVNRNHYAAFISLCMSGALAFQLKIFMSKRLSRLRSALIDQLLSYKVVFLAGLAIGLIALVLSQSRAGFLAFIVSLLLVVIGLGRGNIIADLGFSRRNLLLPGAIVVIAVVAYFGSELLVRFSSDSLLGERVAQWELTWKAIKSAWLLGYGGNSYADVFQIFRGYQDFRQVLFNQSHNDYLHIWLEQGVVGLTLWLSLLTLTLCTAYKSVKSTTSTLVSAALVSTIVVLLAALVQSIVDFNLQILNIRYYFFVIMSLAFSAPTIRQRKGPRKTQFSYN